MIGIWKKDKTPSLNELHCSNCGSTWIVNYLDKGYAQCSKCGNKDEKPIDPSRNKCQNPLNTWRVIHIMYIEGNGSVQAYADMVAARKDHYVKQILNLINEEGVVDDDLLHHLHDTLREYVMLDLTYRKLLDIYMQDV